MDFTILHFAIHIVWRANVICTCRKSGIARKTTVAYPELRLLCRKGIQNNIKCKYFIHKNKLMVENVVFMSDILHHCFLYTLFMYEERKNSKKNNK